MREPSFWPNQLVVVGEMPHIVWRIVEYCPASLRTPLGTRTVQGAKLRPVSWAESINPVGEWAVPLSRLRHVNEMEVIAITCR